MRQSLPHLRESDPRKRRNLRRKRIKKTVELRLGTLRVCLLHRHHAQIPAFYSLIPTPCLSRASLCSDTAPPNPESPSPPSSPPPALSPHPPPRTTSPRHS